MTRTYYIPFFIEITVVSRPKLCGLVLSGERSLTVSVLKGTWIVLILFLLYKAWS